MLICETLSTITSENPISQKSPLARCEKPLWKALSRDSVLNRSKFSIAVSDDRYIIIAGGYGALSRSVVVLDVQTCSLKTLPSLPRENYHGSCGGTILNGYFYLISRYGERPAYRMKLSKWKEWERVDGVEKHYGEGVISNDTNLFLFSDHGNEAFIPRANGWMDLPSMRYPRWAHATTIVENSVYVLGGYNDKLWSPSTLVEVYNIRTRSWSTTSGLPKKLYGAAAVSVGRRWIIVTGGQDEDDRRSDACLILDLQTKKWMESEIRMTCPRANHGSVVIGGTQLVLVGGIDDKNMASDQRLQNISYVESINLSHLLNWYVIKHLILLRKLLDDGRAHSAVYGNDMVLQNLMIYLDLDMFRNVLAFLIIKN